ncbi:menaquinone biosynthesis protein MenH [Mycobacteroides abscessus subsp. abscessus]|nr:menaquinone biosynthesis protein MenH [Mycobacteroides abscessus subsp. abscessus]
MAADFSKGMLAAGSFREVPMVAGDAMALPFADESFDAVAISYGLRNVADPDLAMREMLRVTKPGGRLVIADQRQLAMRMAAAGWSSVQWRNLSGGVVALHRGYRLG